MVAVDQDAGIYCRAIEITYQIRVSWQVDDWDVSSTLGTGGRRHERVFPKSNRAFPKPERGGMKTNTATTRANAPAGMRTCEPGVRALPPTVESETGDTCGSTRS